MYSTVTSHKQSTDTLPNRRGSDEGEGHRPECLPDPTTTLRSNPYNWIVETRRASGMSDVQLSTFCLGRTAVGQSGQEVEQEVMLPGAASRSSRATSATLAAGMVDESPRFNAKTFDMYTTTEGSPISTDGARCGPVIYTSTDHTTITIDDDDDAPVDHRQPESPNSTLVRLFHDGMLGLNKWSK